MVICLTITTSTATDLIFIKQFIDQIIYDLVCLAIMKTGTIFTLDFGYSIALIIWL